MHRTFLLIVALTLSSLLGCDTVTLDGLNGERLDKTDVQPFVGRWMNDDGEVFDFQLAKDGMLIAGSISWDEEQECHIATDQKTDMRRLGTATYALFQEEADKYGFFRVQLKGDDRMQFLSPDPKRFREAVESGTLVGTVIPKKNNHFNVHIKAESDSTEKVFSTSEISDWYDRDLTQNFRCIKRFESDEKTEQ